MEERKRYKSDSKREDGKKEGEGGNREKNHLYLLVSPTFFVSPHRKSHLNTLLDKDDIPNSSRPTSAKPGGPSEDKNMQQIETARKQWRKKEEEKLEESWGSLKQFNRSQKGRLSIDFGGESWDLGIL